MNELEQAQQIAKEHGFELKKGNGVYVAVHTVGDDDMVLDVWASYSGSNPLKVAEAAKDAKYNPLDLNPITRGDTHLPVFIG